MLKAQMPLRRAMRLRRRSPDGEDNDAVIYVESQDHEDQSDTAEASTTSKPNGIVSSSRAPILSFHEISNCSASAGPSLLNS